MQNLKPNEPAGADHPPCGAGHSPNPGLAARLFHDRGTSWLSALEEAVAQLSQTALTSPFADEADDLKDVDLRQRTFKTRRGRRYRLVFVVRDETVYLLGVRAGGQDWLRPDEIQFPDLMP